jgi:dephospho-CoA kinase
MHIVGITGLAGSGKSEIGKYLLSKSFPVIDCDKLGHQVLSEASPVKNQIMNLFGTLDRLLIAEIVFKDPKRLLQLEAIAHPEIKRLLMAELKKYEQQHAQMVFVEAGVLFKMDIADLFNEIWLLECAPEILEARLLQRGWSTAHIKDRLNANENLWQHRHQVHKTLRNDGDIATLLAQVERYLPALAR